jgi:hypothetical protein
MDHDSEHTGRRDDVAAKRIARRRGTAQAIAGWGLIGLTGLAGLVGTSGLAACSSGPPSPGATGTSCGTTRTAANVPVDIQVAKGTVNCATALGVERGYAAMIANGDVRGTGGGAPVRVDGWTCQGYATPDAARTGDASECHTASAEVVAVLAEPSSTASSRPSPTGS